MIMKVPQNADKNHAVISWTCSHRHWAPSLNRRLKIALTVKTKISAYP